MDDSIEEFDDTDPDVYEYSLDIDPRFLVADSFDLMTQGNSLLDHMGKQCFKTSDGKDVMDSGYAIAVVATLCGSLSGVLERLKSELTDSEYKRLNLGDALAGLTMHLGSIKRIEDKIDAKLDKPQGDLLSHEAAAAYLNISEGTLYNWVSAGKIVPSSIGGKVSQFSRLELDRVASMSKKRSKIVPLKGEALYNNKYGVK